MQHHDPAIDRALQLSTFENNYSTEDFISTLSDKLIQESKSNPGAFNPKPFLGTFSPALDQLLSLRSQVAERTKKMETEVRRAEREYGRRLRELDGGFEVCPPLGGNAMLLMIGYWKFILEPRDQDIRSQQIICKDRRTT
jgi:hypothetical protein